jgi:hypothetical protein
MPELYPIPPPPSPDQEALRELCARWASSLVPTLDPDALAFVEDVRQRIDSIRERGLVLWKQLEALEVEWQKVAEDCEVAAGCTASEADYEVAHRHPLHHLAYCVGPWVSLGATGVPVDDRDRSSQPSRGLWWSEGLEQDLQDALSKPTAATVERLQERLMDTATRRDFPEWLSGLGLVLDWPAQRLAANAYIMGKRLRAVKPAFQEAADLKVFDYTHVIVLELLTLVDEPHEIAEAAHQLLDVEGFPPEARAHYAAIFFPGEEDARA